jgi:hypothetical protein
MMTRTTVGRAVLAAALAALAPVGARAADVHVGINIGVPPPPPPVVVEAPPPLVVVPGSPVYYAPQLPYNYFYYSGRYYTFHDGAWFSSVSFAGPWGFVSLHHVPPPLLAVPVRYYRVPPAHWHKHHGPPPWAGHGRGHLDGGPHGHGHGHGRH